jgi:hypothetical protein
MWYGNEVMGVSIASCIINYVLSVQAATLNSDASATLKERLRARGAPN